MRSATLPRPSAANSGRSDNGTGSVSPTTPTSIAASRRSLFDPKLRVDGLAPRRRPRAGDVTHPCGRPAALGEERRGRLEHQRARLGRLLLAASRPVRPSRSLGGRGRHDAAARRVTHRASSALGLAPVGAAEAVQQEQAEQRRAPCAPRCRSPRASIPSRSQWPSIASSPLRLVLDDVLLLDGVPLAVGDAGGHHRHRLGHLPVQVWDEHLQQAVEGLDQGHSRRRRRWWPCTSALPRRPLPPPGRCARGRPPSSPAARLRPGCAAGPAATGPRPRRCGARAGSPASRSRARPMATRC